MDGLAGHTALPLVETTLEEAAKDLQDVATTIARALEWEMRIRRSTVFRRWLPAARRRKFRGAEPSTAMELSRGSI